MNQAAPPYPGAAPACSLPCLSSVGGMGEMRSCGPRPEGRMRKSRISSRTPPFMKVNSIALLVVEPTAAANECIFISTSQSLMTL